MMTAPSLDFASLTAICDRIEARAGRVDEDAALPVDDLHDLHVTGLAKVVAPDGKTCSLVCNPRPLSHILQMIGAANLTVGRLYEGHVNAARLIHQFGGTAAAAIFNQEAAAGRLLGVWNAERGDDGPRIVTVDGGWLLSGRKIHCSGAGHVRRPIVTARDGNDEVVMLLPDVDSLSVKIDIRVWRATGMRGTATATIVFDKLFVPKEAMLGIAGDYYRSPYFSGGAWRVLAVQLGGLQQILKLHAERLQVSGRDRDAIFRARFAEAAADFETARLLVAEAARRAESIDVNPSIIDAYVDLARARFESLALSSIAAARLNIGLSSFIAPDPLDRCIRDLETYLRQPFVDASRDNAARWLLPRGGVFDA